MGSTGDELLTNDPETTPNWPRLLVSSSGDDKTLPNRSPFAVNKAVEGVLGTPKSIKRLRSGNFLLEGNHSSQAGNLLKTKLFVDVPVPVTRHRSLKNCSTVFQW